MGKGIEIASYDPKKINVIVAGRVDYRLSADGVVTACQE